MSTQNPGDTPLSRNHLAADLTALLSLPQPISSSLLPGSPASDSRSTTNTANPSALAVLDQYSTSTAGAEASQGLIKAYIRDMREDVLRMDKGEGEKLGVRIDIVREKGEAIQDALGGVRL